MDPQTLAQCKILLEKERDELRARLRATAKQDPDNPENWNARYPKFEATESGNKEDEAEEFEEYEGRIEAEHDREARLRDVERALARIEKNTYGTCPRCGKEISLERLRANPAAECEGEHA